MHEEFHAYPKWFQVDGAAFPATPKVLPDTPFKSFRYPERFHVASQKLYNDKMKVTYHNIKLFRVYIKPLGINLERFRCSAKALGYYSKLYRYSKKPFHCSSKPFASCSEPFARYTRL
jgi:hypothetical protein